MFFNDLRALAATLASSGLLFVGGCAAETGASVDPLIGDAAVPAPSIRIPDDLEEVAAPDWRVRASVGLIDGCSGAICDTGEQCCALTGECVPVDCDDCCVNPEIPAGPNTDPELDPPEGPDEPR